MTLLAHKRAMAHHSLAAFRARGSGLRQASAFNAGGNTPASPASRDPPRSDGSKSLSLIVHNHTAHQRVMAASSRHQTEPRVRSDLGAASYLSFRKGRRRKPSSSSTTTQAKPSYRPLCKLPRSNDEGSLRLIRLKLRTEKSSLSNFSASARCDCPGSELALCASSGSTSPTCWREEGKSFWCLPTIGWSWITSPPSLGKRWVKSAAAFLAPTFFTTEAKTVELSLLYCKLFVLAVNRGLDLLFRRHFALHEVPPLESRMRKKPCKLHLVLQLL